MGYVGRFAPSPTGALHPGSLVAALASWLDARAHGGRWLVRIEDTDGPRCVDGADRVILGQLSQVGLLPDEPPRYQSAGGARYQAALDELTTRGLAYPCACSRSDILRALGERGTGLARHAGLRYPGTCRHGLDGRPARAWRLLCAPERAAPASAPLVIDWVDRRLGEQRQSVAEVVGDFVLKRADGPWAYQLAVVVDDAAQDVTHVVRGADLADNTPRQIHLQRVLGLPTPSYFHTPLVLGVDGAKLSKQNGAIPVVTADPLVALRAAGLVLGITVPATDRGAWLEQATSWWSDEWCGP